MIGGINLDDVKKSQFSNILVNSTSSLFENGCIKMMHIHDSTFSNMSLLNCVSK